MWGSVNPWPIHVKDILHYVYEFHIIFCKSMAHSEGYIICMNSI